MTHNGKRIARLKGQSNKARLKEQKHADQGGREHGRKALQSANVEPRMLPETSEGNDAGNDEPGAQAPFNLNIEQKKQIRDKLNLKEKIEDSALDTENYDILFLDATQTDLKALARACGVKTNGSKVAITTRIIEWYAGVVPDVKEKKSRSR